VWRIGSAFLAYIVEPCSPTTCSLWEVVIGRLTCVATLAPVTVTGLAKLTGVSASSYWVSGSSTGRTIDETEMSVIPKTIIIQHKYFTERTRPQVANKIPRPVYPVNVKSRQRIFCSIA
jgi:hypothetical protein